MVYTVLITEGFAVQKTITVKKLLFSINFNIQGDLDLEHNNLIFSPGHFGFHKINIKPNQGSFFKNKILNLNYIFNFNLLEETGSEKK